MPATGRPHVADALVPGRGGRPRRGLRALPHPGRPATPGASPPTWRTSSARRRGRRRSCGRPPVGPDGPARAHRRGLRAPEGRRARRHRGRPPGPRRRRPRGAARHRPHSTSSSPGRATTTGTGQGRPRPWLQHHRARGARPDPRARRLRAGREGRPMGDVLVITLLTSSSSRSRDHGPVGTVPIFLSLTGGRSRPRPGGRPAGARPSVRGDLGVRVPSASGSSAHLHTAAGPPVCGRAPAPAGSLELLTGNEKEPSPRPARTSPWSRSPRLSWPARGHRRDHAVLPPRPRLRPLRCRLALRTLAPPHLGRDALPAADPAPHRESGVLLVTRIAPLLLSADRRRACCSMLFRAFIVGEG